MGGKGSGNKAAKPPAPPQGNIRAAVPGQDQQLKMKLSKRRRNKLVGRLQELGLPAIPTVISLFCHELFYNQFDKVLMDKQDPFWGEFDRLYLEHKSDDVEDKPIIL